MTGRTLSLRNVSLCPLVLTERPRSSGGPEFERFEWQHTHTTNDFCRAPLLPTLGISAHTHYPQATATALTLVGCLFVIEVAARGLWKAINAAQASVFPLRPVLLQYCMSTSAICCDSDAKNSQYLTVYFFCEKYSKNE